MQIQPEFTDELILQEIGKRLAQARLERNLSQAQLAEAAGISKRTLERLESGSTSTQLPTFIRATRALGLLPGFDKAIPQPVPSPIELVKLQGKKRKRASQKRVEKKTSKKWTWGD
jgi:transcriptional regulator with XRE-family HTH domain